MKSFTKMVLENDEAENFFNMLTGSTTKVDKEVIIYVFFHNSDVKDGIELYQETGKIDTLRLKSAEFIKLPSSWNLEYAIEAALEKTYSHLPKPPVIKKYDPTEVPGIFEKVIHNHVFTLYKVDILLGTTGGDIEQDLYCLICEPLEGYKFSIT